MKFKKKIIIPFIFVVAALAWLIWGPLKDKPEASQNVPSHLPEVAKVVAVPVKEMPLLRQGFEETGSIEAIERVTLYPKVTGRLEELRAHQGDKVQKGHVIAVLDHRDIDAQIASLKAGIVVSEAQVAEARAALNNAKVEWERYQRLVKEGYATQQQLDNKETAYLQAEARSQLAKASVDQTRAQLQNLEVSLSEYSIKASINGIVLNDYAHTVGTMMTPSTAVAEIANVDTLKAVVRVPESRAFSLSKGMVGLIKADGLGDGVFEGKIARMSPFVKEDTRTVQVEFFIDNRKSGYQLRPGMFARVFMVQEERPEALVVPPEALFTNSESPSVLLVEDGKVKHTPVTLGLKTDTAVQITEGVKEGDLVVISGGNHLQTGNSVEVSVRK